MPTFSDELARQLGLTDLDEDKKKQLTAAFDAEFYLRANRDLRSFDGDPLAHYLIQGWRECRDPSADFQTLSYLLQNRDVLRAGVNPFVCAVLGKDRLLPRIPLEAVAAKPDQDGSRGTNFSQVPSPSSTPSGCENLKDLDVERLRTAFDRDYYFSHNPDVRAAGVDPFQHYMALGWREGRDPCPTFSTKFYVTYYPDIGASQQNPFIHWVLHGQDEKRSSISFQQRLDQKTYAPTVSAIIPNFNHGKFLAERLESVLQQTYPHVSITVLDDCSTDASREVIDSYVEKYSGRIRAIYNEKNSGGVFRQWRKGVLETEGDLVWICESDDFCEPDFLEKLVPYFRDNSVQVAFGRILETDIDGVANHGLDDYREFAEPGIWDRPLVRPAPAWFAKAFGVRNVIANVGGCIWRRAPVPDAVWEEAGSYSVVGDWYLYIQIASGGQIAWEPEAVSYFRRHGSNTSSTSFTRPKFYTELERLMLSLARTWDIPNETRVRFYDKIVEQYDWFGVDKKYGPLERHLSLTKLQAAQRSRPHVLIAMYGLIPGGGENFPIFLANGLVAAGWTVSMLIFETSETNEHMREALNPAVSIYEAAWVVEYGADRFLKDAGISLIHSHTVGAELHFFHVWRIKADPKFLVTLHGSYEASELPLDVVETITAPVDHFVYTADKNLIPLAELDIPKERFTKLANAMPVDLLPFPKMRSELGIAEDAIVFTLVARGIKRKGWRASIDGFNELRRRHPDRSMHLCLVGEGEEPDRHREKYGNDPSISFLGYQSRISGLYRMTDVAIVPSRFSGESYPLCIIQALQVGTPVIGSDVGEIRRMLTPRGKAPGGLVIHAARDTKKFVTALADAMEKMLVDESLRKQLANGAQVLGEDYNMNNLVKTYGSIYRKLLGVGPTADEGLSGEAHLTASHQLIRAEGR